MIFILILLFFHKHLGSLLFALLFVSGEKKRLSKGKHHTKYNLTYYFWGVFRATSGDIEGNHVLLGTKCALRPLNYLLNLQNSAYFKGKRTDYRERAAFRNLLALFSQDSHMLWLNNNKKVKFVLEWRRKSCNCCSHWGGLASPGIPTCLVLFWSQWGYIHDRPWNLCTVLQTQNILDMIYLTMRWISIHCNNLYEAKVKDFCPLMDTEKKKENRRVEGTKNFRANSGVVVSAGNIQQCL